MKYETEVVDRGPLTAREAEVMGLACSAMSDKDIARALAISINTVSKHLEEVYRKLGVQNKVLNRRVCMIRAAIARGMIRMLCLMVSFSSVLQDDQALVMRARVARPLISTRRFD